ncbi:MAG: ABC transporter permease [Candidatus Sumerlaeia bacterium]|nr:ABC transporter permease [Candidatus Sumerlaeia bacterium]
MLRFLSEFERKVGMIYAATGGMLILLVRAFMEIRLGRNERGRLLRQMVIVGWQTVPLALLIGLFTGMTVALGTGLVLAGFGQQVFIASIVAESMVKEMGPVFTAFIIAARVGAAMTAELGTMAVNDEVDVLRVLGISVNRYLVMPRIVAAVTMTPALTAYAVCLGLLGGYVVAGPYFGVSWVTYKAEAFRVLTTEEVLKGLSKGVFFGAVYSSVCCYFGLQTRGGAEGVGKATTSGVVISLSGILVTNYLLTRYMFG